MPKFEEILRAALEEQAKVDEHNKKIPYHRIDDEGKSIRASYQTAIWWSRGLLGKIRNQFNEEFDTTSSVNDYDGNPYSVETGKSSAKLYQNFFRKLFDDLPPNTANGDSLKLARFADLFKNLPQISNKDADSFIYLMVHFAIEGGWFKEKQRPYLFAVAAAGLAKSNPAVGADGRHVVHPAFAAAQQRLLILVNWFKDKGLIDSAGFHTTLHHGANEIGFILNGNLPLPTYLSRRAQPLDNLMTILNTKAENLKPDEQSEILEIDALVDERINGKADVAPSTLTGRAIGNFFKGPGGTDEMIAVWKQAKNAKVGQNAQAGPSGPSGTSKT